MSQNRIKHSSDTSHCTDFPPLFITEVKHFHKILHFQLLSISTKCSSLISDRKVTLVILATTTWMTKVTFLRHHPSPICLNRDVPASESPAPCRKQPSRGHVPFNAALIEFAACWTGHIAQSNTIGIVGRKHCEAILVEQAKLPAHKSVKATFTYPHYWWANHIKNMN